MALKCNNPQNLIEFIEKNYPRVKTDHPTGIQTKFVFECGLVTNVFSNGTVNFQGRSHQNPIVSDLKNVITAIDRNGGESNPSSLAA